VLINWFTVLAQAVNFLLLIYLLKRFLYGPILKAMNAREKRISDRLNDAEAARQKALTQAQESAKERQAFENSKEALLADARIAVQQWQETATGQAYQEIEASRKAWQESLKEEKDLFSRQLKSRVAEQVFFVSRKVLSDLAREDLEVRIIDVFLEKVKTEQEAFREKNLQTQKQVAIQSGFKLSAKIKARVTDSIKTLFPRAANIGFEVEPEFGFGIRLLSGDWKVEWNLYWYMQGMEDAVLPLLSATARDTA
jgi:F-type H+-transporting ATPase subunit b